MKRVLVFAFLAMVTTAAFSQINFGAKAGVNFASFNGDGTDDFDGRTSFHFGGLVEIELTDMFAVQPEILFSSQGVTAEGSESEFGITYSYDEKLKLNYLNLPVMLKVYVVDGFAFEIGPQLGFLLSANYEYDYSEGGDSESGEDDVKDDFKGTDIGGAFGASYKMENGLFLSGRYVLGFTEVNEGSADGFSPKNSVFQLSLGWIFY